MVKGRKSVSNDIEAYRHEADKRKNTVPENSKKWRKKGGQEFGMVFLQFREYRVREIIREKQIRAVKIGQWSVRTEDLEEFVKSRSNL